MRCVGSLVRHGDGKDAFEDFGGGAWTTIRKTVDQPRASTATLADDTALVAALGIGTWVVRGVALFVTANATMDLKYDCAFSGAATIDARTHRHIVAGAAAGTDNETTTIGSGAMPSTAVAGTTSGIARVEFEVLIGVSAAGTFAFRWAQNTADPAALTCKRGSWLEYAAS